MQIEGINKEGASDIVGASLRERLRELKIGRVERRAKATEFDREKDIE